MQGKYSPAWVKKDCIFNCYGKVPAHYGEGDEYDQKTMFADYDDEGYDSYGYSAFDKYGEYVGISSYGVDRLGYCEIDYWSMPEDEFFELYYAWRSRNNATNV